MVLWQIHRTARDSIDSGQMARRIQSRHRGWIDSGRNSRTKKGRSDQIASASRSTMAPAAPAAWHPLYGVPAAPT